jgi:hypothetical protein
MKRLIACCVLMALVLTACARPSERSDPKPTPEQGAGAHEPSPAPGPAQGQPGQGQPEQPGQGQPGQEQPGQAVAAPEVGTCIPASTANLPYGYLDASRAVMQGLCGGAVPEDEFAVNFSLPPTVTEAAARAALQVDGPAQPEWVSFAASPQMATLWLLFPKGKLGETFTIRLAGPVGVNGAAADLGFVLRRMESPTARAELKVGDGAWQPLVPGATVPAQPLYLRFTFTGNPSPEQIERRIKDAFAPGKDDTTKIVYHLQWEGPQRLLLSLPAPPPRILIDLSFITGDHGLYIRRFTFVLYTGQEPRLVALDPATGQENEVGPAPVDVLGRQLSPDGKWVLVTALRGDSNNAADTYLLDTETATLRMTPLLQGTSYWLADRLVMAVSRKVQVYDLSSHQVAEYPTAMNDPTVLSPDGRYLTGFSLDYEREDPETSLAPATIVIHDLQAHTERTFADIASVRVPHKEVPPSLPMDFSPDSTTLYYREQVKGTATGQGQATRWMQLDLRTGKTGPASAREMPQRYEPVKGPTGWQYVSAGWGPIQLLTPEGDGKSFGSGLVLGWRPDGRLLVIRWPNFERRRFQGI